MEFHYYLFGDRNIKGNIEMDQGVQESIIKRIDNKTKHFYSVKQLKDFVKSYIKNHYNRSTKLTLRNINTIINGTVKFIEQNHQKQFLRVASHPTSNNTRNVVLINGGYLAGIGVEFV